MEGRLSEDMEQKKTKPNKASKNKSIFIIILIVCLIFILLAVGAFLIWQTYYKDINKNNSFNQKTTQSDCGSLITEDGKTSGLAPYSPVVKAKIVGTFPKDKAICHWTVNGEDYGTSQPYGDYCIRYGLTFYNVGDYKISYKVDGLENCTNETTLKVTGVTEAEAKRIIEIKKSGMRPETREEVEANE